MGKGANITTKDNRGSPRVIEEINNSNQKNSEEFLEENMDKDGLMKKYWMVNINYQHSLDKFKRCKDSQMERETIEEMELNIKKLNMLFHEILLL